MKRLIPLVAVLFLLAGCTQGCGPGVENVPTPETEATPTPLFTTGSEERSGMGFTIMESFMDTLKVRSVPERGTTVTMRRRISRRLGGRV